MCRFLITALSITVLVPLVSALNYGDCTTSSRACPDGSECVKGSCIDCEADPRKCLLSVEKCQALQCPSDQGCYVIDKVEGETITSTAGCAPKNPCAGKNCGDDASCVNAVVRDMPPVAQCRLYNPDPCSNNKTCPSGQNCALRRASCGDYSCIVEPLCVDEHDCEDCDYSYQFCEIEMDNGIAKGQCSNFKDRWDD